MIYTGTLVVMDCCRCNMTFGVPSDFDRRNLEVGSSFYCPSGHVQHYTASENAKLKKELEGKQQALVLERTRVDYWRDEQKRTELMRRAAKGQLTKTKNRIAKGDCPCCNRSFTDLTRHMESQHPEYAS